MELYVKLDKGDVIVRNDHTGTFIVRKHGHCFISIDRKLKDYVDGEKVRVDYLGYMAEISDSCRLFEDLDWRIYEPNVPLKSMKRLKKEKDQFPST